jgi:hypothetical protein
MNIAYYLSLAGEYQARRQGAAAAAVGHCSGDGGLSSYAPEIGSSCEDVVLTGNFCIQPEKKHGRLADTSAHKKVEDRESERSKNANIILANLNMTNLIIWDILIGQGEPFSC